MHRPVRLVARVWKWELGGRGGNRRICGDGHLHGQTEFYEKKKKTQRSLKQECLAFYILLLS